ncbi:MAG: class I SAM-dependent methyltransferase [Melioribacteraceae bacterium]|nr:class I SAM-dependent methyltransferase [Melioribacteraceae bacterium]
MSFYSVISNYYDELFPYQEKTCEFLKRYTIKNSGVLDLGCGTGLYLNELSNDVAKAAGIDLDEEMIKVASSKSVKAEFKVLNILDIEKVEGKFDLIYSIGNVLSYLDHQNFELLTEKISSKLNENGKWIFQTVNWDKLKSQNSFEFPVKELKERLVKFYRSYERIDSESVWFKVKIEEDEKVVFENRDQLFNLLSEEVISIHEKHHLKLESHFGGFNFAEYDESKSPASIYVFSK